MLDLINYKNITFLAEVKVTIDNFEEISREEDSNDIGNGVVIGDIIDDMIGDKLDEEKSTEVGAESPGRQDSSVNVSDSALLIKLRPSSESRVRACSGLSASTSVLKKALIARRAISYL